jgi:hypothetical protein
LNFFAAIAFFAHPGPVGGAAFFLVVVRGVVVLTTAGVDVVVAGVVEAGADEATRGSTEVCSEIAGVGAGAGVSPEHELRSSAPAITVKPKGIRFIANDHLTRN